VSDPSVAFEYRFGGVRVDVAGHRLWVDDRLLHCPARVFALLAMLCEADGRVRSRDQLLSALWSADEDVSDESLTQLVFRLRALLGAHAESIATVRGVGVRLAAPLQRFETATADDGPQRPARREEPTVPAPQTPSTAGATAGSDRAASSVSTSPPPSTTRRRLLPLLLLTVACLLLASLLWQQRQPPVGDWIDRGHGVRADDAHAEHRGTIDLLRTAFRAEAGGDRARAATLLQSIHRSDARTPIAALFLGYFAIAAGDEPAAQEWLQQATQRIAPLHDPYIEVLRDYIVAIHDDDWNAEMRASGALLDLRPEAWAMRTARSHLFLARGMRDAALREVRQIAVPALDHRKLEMALADRAALGDIAGAQAALARLPFDADSPAQAFLRARIAYSRGDIGAARAGFARAVETGLRGNRLDLVTRAQMLGGILAMDDGDEADARARLQDAFARVLDRQQRYDAVELGLMMAQIEALAGDAPRAALALTQVRALLGAASTNTDQRLRTELFALRLTGKDGGLAPSDDASPSLDHRGLSALFAARRALLAGDRPGARTAADAALAAGVLDTEFGDEARLLAAELGIPTPVAVRIDPPNQPLSRFASRWALDAIQSPPSR
jgi:DNA-binding winged helix-turn-helix (wHTH) protein